MAIFITREQKGKSRIISENTDVVFASIRKECRAKVVASSLEKASVKVDEQFPCQGVMTIKMMKK